MLAVEEARILVFEEGAKEVEVGSLSMGLFDKGIEALEETSWH